VALLHEFSRLVRACLSSGQPYVLRCDALDALRESRVLLLAGSAPLPPAVLESALGVWDACITGLQDGDDQVRESARAAVCYALAATLGADAELQDESYALDAAFSQLVHTSASCGAAAEVAARLAASRLGAYLESVAAALEGVEVSGPPIGAHRPTEPTTAWDTASLQRTAFLHCSDDANDHSEPRIVFARWLELLLASAVDGAPAALRATAQRVLTLAAGLSASAELEWSAHMSAAHVWVVARGAPPPFASAAVGLARMLLGCNE
jgi:hypothetical protein